MPVKISNNVYLIDALPCGYPRQISSYLIVGEEHVMLIDPGPQCSVEHVFEEARNVVDRIDYIALTHIHLDHGGGAAALARRMEYKSKILVHPRGAKHLVDPSRLWEATRKVLGPQVADMYGRPENAPKEIVVSVEDEALIGLGGGVEVKILHTPGHAPHHVVYIVYPDNIVFTGDAVAIYYDGRIHPVSPPPFKTELAIQSIDKIIAEKPDKVTVAHYGLAREPGVNLLERAKSKIIWWRDFIKEQVSKGVRDPEKIYEKILEVDEETAYIVRIRENNPLFEKSAYRSVLGILYDLLEQK